MADKHFGRRQKRVDDPRLMTGNASYTDDVVLPGMCHAVFVRSPFAHARITSIDTDDARRQPGVLAVYTGADIADTVNPIPTAWLVPDADLKTPPHPALAVDTVRYTGDAVAVVVAETLEAANDAAEQVWVEYEELDVVVDMEAAVSGDAPALHADAPRNLAFDWVLDSGGVAEAFAEADVVVSQRMTNCRLVPAPMETRGAVAQYNAASDQLTLWCGSQNPHIHRFLLSVILPVAEHRIRVIATEIGGGFGCKIPCYPDEVVVSYCAMKLRRPVKWSETRRESFVATTHGRDHVVDLELAVTKDGTVTGLRGTCHANLGAYLSTAAPGVPTILQGLMMSGCYTIPAIRYEVFGVFTNTTPVDAYRGAGRPEACYYVERLMDLAAIELNMDPLALRRRNFVPADAFPHTVATTLEYDSGNYQGGLAAALDVFDYDAFRAEQAAARETGRYLGVGFCTYVEICGLGPSKVAGAIGFQGGLWESSIIRVHPTGKVSVMIGANPHGQGEKTTFAQVVADQFGIALEDVDIIHGDTDQTPMGWGTYGSRTTPVAGAAVAVAAGRVIEKARTIAAHQLEAAVEDVEFADGVFHVKGAPDNGKTFADIALQAHLAWDLPEGLEPNLEERSFYDPPNFVYPFGTHICTVEIDPDTGVVDVTRYVAVDDCGPVINPLIVAGQVHGGITQGLAQALYESAEYDENGQLITGSLADYAVPKAHQVPYYETGHTETASPHHPLGVKGVGETGTIASAAAVANAVMDALSPLGVRHLDMPLTPERVWTAIHERTA
jgi:carbon-monoxide dehydrogenase large subunit